MCILDFIKNCHSSKPLSDKLYHQLMNRQKYDNLGIIYFNENISMMEKKLYESSYKNARFGKTMFNANKDWETNTATFDFSSDDREKSLSSTDDDGSFRQKSINSRHFNHSNGGSSSCTLCTSSFSFCNASVRSSR